MKQNVRDSEIKYQEFLILAYFRANYKKYDFADVTQMMGMTYAEMQNSILLKKNKSFKKNSWVLMNHIFQLSLKCSILNRGYIC